MLATVTRILNRARLRGRMHVANLNRNKHLGCGAVGSHLPCNRLHSLSISSRPAMSRPTPPSLLALVLIAGNVAPALAGEVMLPRNEKGEAIHAGKGFGKQGSAALPVIAMAV